MKITFIYPRIKQSDFGSGSLDYPIGVLALSSYLKREISGIEVSVIDATFMKSWQEFKKAVKREKADIYGFSFSSPLADEAYKAIKFTKDIYPKSLIIAGGPHPTVDPISVIKKGAKVVVIGEGEEPLKQLVCAFKNGRNYTEVESIYFRDSQKAGTITSNPRKNYTTSLQHSE